MIEFDTIPKVTIDLQTGLYLFTPLSATGKTYLASVLQKLSDRDERVVVYSYREYRNHVNLERLTEERNCEILLLDRYDMYNGSEDVVQAALRVAKHGIVLIDVKAAEVPGISECKYADIKLSSDRIEVYE